MMDFNRSMSTLMREIVSRVPEFQRIDPHRVLVSATFNRSRRKSGLLAYVLPLKYREGSPVESRVRGKKIYHWAMLPTFHDGKEILYIIYFMLPRFLDLTFAEKLETVVHEIYHINPTFNGDLRRFKGRSRLHGSMKEYDRKVKELTAIFLESEHNPETYEFLRNTFQQASDRFGEVRAKHIREPRPKLLKVATLSPWDRISDF